MLDMMPQIAATLKRYSAGADVDGRWVPGTPVETPVTVVAPQPASGRNLQFLPDGERVYTHKKVWTETALLDGDVLSINGTDYLVNLIGNYYEACQNWVITGFYRALIREIQP